MVMNVDGWDDNPPAEGYCEHGRYVGGCGYDLMCGWCEDDISAKEQREIIHAQYRHKAFGIIEIYHNVILPALFKHLNRQAILAYFSLDEHKPVNHSDEWAYNWCVEHNEWPEVEEIVYA